MIEKKLIVVLKGFVRLGVQRHEYETQITASSINQESE